MIDSPAAPSPELTLTRDESAFFMKAFWKALVAPKWPRGLIIELGKLVHARKPLTAFSQEELGAFLPNLRVMANTFGETLLEQIGQKPRSLEKDEVAYLIRTLWDGLLAPEWTIDHLIELGKCAYSRLDLAHLADHQFETIFPTIANKIGPTILSQPEKLQKQVSTAPAPHAAPPSATQPAPVAPTSPAPAAAVPTPAAHPAGSPGDAPHNTSEPDNSAPAAESEVTHG